eukprot:CFRG2296T1
MSFNQGGARFLRQVLINDGRLPPKAMSMINRQLAADGVTKKLNKRNAQHVPRGKKAREKEIANCKGAYWKVLQQKISYLSKDYRH